MSYSKAPQRGRLILTILLFAFSPFVRADSAPGYLLREVYSNIPGSKLVNLVFDPKVQNNKPDSISLVGQFETGRHLYENYGVRLSGYLIPPVTGNYTFYLASDDEGVLYLSTDDQAANKRDIAREPSWSNPREWINSSEQAARGNPPKNISAPVFLQAGKRYYVEALAKEGTGGDHLAVAWRLPGARVPVNGDPPISGQYLATPDNSPPNLCAGLRGEYFFANQNLTGQAIIQTDPTVNMEFQVDPVNNHEAYSVRWTGFVVPRYSETYRFTTLSDDGVRLWVNGQLLINNWTEHAPSSDSGFIDLQGDKPYEIKMEYFENDNGGAQAKLFWWSRSQPEEIVPQGRLIFCTQLPPVITKQPTSVIVPIGGSPTFTVEATGTAPLSYQWRKEGQNIPGATAPTYSIASVQQSHDGRYEVVVSNAGGSITSQTVRLTVQIAPNTPPTISTVTDQTMAQDSASSVTFTVNDAETPLQSLTLTAASENAALIAPSGIVFGGTGGNRTASLAPSAGQSGTARLTITVSDGGGLSASRSFLVTVTRRVDPPSGGIIIASGETKSDRIGPGEVDRFTFTGSVGEKATIKMTWTGGAATFNPTFDLLGPDSSKLKTVTAIYSAIVDSFPLPSSGTYSIVCRDDDNSSSGTYSLSLNIVGAAGTPPTISDISDQVTQQDAAKKVSFTIDDKETPVDALSLTAASSNSDLLPSARIVLSGSGRDREAALAPNPGKSGTTTVTITLTDSGGLSARESFILTVTPVPLPTGGTVNFNNRLPGVVDARVVLRDGTGVGSGWTAELMAGPEGGTLAPVKPSTTFRTTSDATKGYVEPVTVSVPNVAPGARATLVLRAFNGASFDVSTLRGQSKPIVVALGGVGSPPSLPVNLVGLEGFTVGIIETSPFVVRQLPSSYAPGVKFTVVLKATPSTGTSNYAVEDRPPAGWKVSAVSDGGLHDAGNQKVKWGPFFDSIVRNLSYEITAPFGETGRKEFAGAGAADLTIVVVGGAISIDAITFHPADNNPGDGRLTIGEVTAYGVAWKKEESWPIPPNPILADYVTRAGALWKNGEAYTIDSSISTPPLWWVNTPAKVGPQGYGLRVSAASGGSAASSFSALFVPGENLVVQISVQPAGTVSAYTVQDQVPAGWTVAHISDGGAFAPQSGQVRWGPFFDNQPRQLSYEIASSSESPEFAVFLGAVSFDGASAVIGGQRQSRATGRLQSLKRLPNGQLQLQVSGRREVKWVIEASLNLVDWTPVGATVNADGTLQINDPMNSNTVRRFYRARLP